MSTAVPSSRTGCVDCKKGGGKMEVYAIGGKCPFNGTHPNAAGRERFYMEPIAALLKRL